MLLFIHTRYTHYKYIHNKDIHITRAELGAEKCIVLSLKSESEPKGKVKHVNRFFFFKLFTSLPSDRQLSPSIHGSSYIPLSLHFCFFFTQTQRQTDSDCSFWGSLLNLNLKLLLHLTPNKLKNYLNHNSNNLSFWYFRSWNKFSFGLQNSMPTTLTMLRTWNRLRAQVDVHHMLTTITVWLTL